MCRRTAGRFISVIVAQLRCKRLGMRSVDESRTGLATIRGTPRVATPHNLQFVLTLAPHSFPPYVQQLYGSVTRNYSKQRRSISESSRFTPPWPYQLPVSSFPIRGNMSLNGPVYRLVRLLLLVGVFNAVSAVIKGNTDNQHYQQQVKRVNVSNRVTESLRTCEYL